MIGIAISPPAHMWIFVDISGVIDKIPPWPINLAK